MRKTILLTAAAILLLGAIPAEGRRLTRRLPTPKPDKTALSDSGRIVVSIEGDSIAATRLDSLSAKGYDKPVDASAESIFITNGCCSGLLHVTLRITYSDMKGNLLHRRDVDIDCDVPPGETRKLDFPTWDRQRSFYYHGSRAPKRRQATPYRIKAEIISAAFLP